MITDKDRMEASYDDPYILITDKKISAIKDLLPILKKNKTLIYTNWIDFGIKPIQNFLHQQLGKI